MAESVQPLVQPPVEDLRQVLQIAQFWQMGMGGYELTDTQKVCADIERLVRHAIEGLSEPNAAAIKAARELDDDGSGILTDRYYRDTVAAILNAQLTGTL